MSANIETLLYDEIDREFDKLSTMEPGSEEYKVAVDGIAKLMDRAIEIDKVDADAKDKAETRKVDQQLKERQLKDERVDRWIRNAIGVAGVLLPIGVTIWGTLVTLRFEETGAVTTNMGRGFIQRLLPKK